MSNKKRRLERRRKERQKQRETVVRHVEQPPVVMVEDGRLVTRKAR